MTHDAKKGIAELIERVKNRRDNLPSASERRRIREEANVSQRELGRALGVSWMAVSGWERGSRPRDDVVRAAYAQLLQDIQRILDETQP